MECGPGYPKEPPVIHFVSQINLPGVSQVDGRVDKQAVAILRDWERISAELSKNPRPKEDPLSLEAALIAIRKYVKTHTHTHTLRPLFSPLSARFVPPTLPSAGGSYTCLTDPSSYF